MTIRLGYFQDFKGSDIVLLSCEPVEVVVLRASLSDAMKRGAPVAIHDVALVSGRHTARLFVFPGAGTLHSSEPDFAWCISESEYADIDSKLAVLKSAAAAHQYFTLAHTNAKLMVSVGEYSDVWWQHAA